MFQCEPANLRHDRNSTDTFQEIEGKPMKHLMTVLALSLVVLTTTAFAADAPKASATCEAQATEKKLAGAAKTSFMTKCNEDAKSAAMAASPECEKSAADKKLAGAAKTSFMKKCNEDAKSAAMAASPECEKSAADKKLAGAAKTSHLKKCMADAKK
jgi:hypothetical protein